MLQQVCLQHPLPPLLLQKTCLLRPLLLLQQP
jgi:hypothetical protein